jgi:hypothetical protein
MITLLKKWFLALPLEGKSKISGWTIDPNNPEHEALAFNDWCMLSVYDMLRVYEMNRDEYYEHTKGVSFWIDDFDYYMDKYAS